MECPSCAAKVSEGSRFCSNCGAALSVHCQECAHNNAAGSKFCANCGTRLTASNQAKPAEVVNPLPAVDSAERRQMTVMICDLVGSTALSARLDPEDLRTIIATARIKEAWRDIEHWVCFLADRGFQVSISFDHAAGRFIVDTTTGKNH
jgi:Double zinc ribbon